ncbi:transmembrane glucosamine N-acetyltransferase NagX [Shewanella atlantica]|uniref:transmembrane glucosamine N-acetyltransferase NagX n=1 Tax=Shewanella atlantica TaxID=271099 RepID=UPI00373700EA
MDVARAKVSKPRLMSLDALRGFDMFWILGGEALFAGLLLLTGWQGWQWFDAQMHHSQWHGFTFYDLIFPLFIFLSGVALGLSPKRLDSLPVAQRIPVYKHAVKRLLLLIFLGVLYNHGWGSGAPVVPGEVRYASVLGRIAFAWFFAAILVWHTSLRTQIIVTIGLLVGYALLQLFFPVPGYGAGNFTAQGSVNGFIDTHLLPGVSYRNRPFDPEGILSTIPAVTNALAGVFVGHFIVKPHPKGEWTKVAYMLLTGALVLGLGWALDYVVPVNKDLWTSSFTLVTIGWSLILLSIFYAVVDLLKWQKLAFPFVVIGCNAIIIYLASSLINWKFTAQGLFGGVIEATPASAQQLLLVISVLFVQWLLLFWMYKRDIFIKV